jgi:hypothetical protein
VGTGRTMAEILAINNNNSPHHSPSRSPHKHVLRPRASFYRTTLPSFLPKQIKRSEGDSSLRSPLKLSLAEGGRIDSANNLENNSVGSSSSSTRQSSRGRGGALLFPASPDTNPSHELNSHSSNNNLSPATATRRDASGGLRKFASSVSGAFANAKVRTSTRRTTKPGFDLSDWNYDLAAIASHPSSAASSPRLDPIPAPIPPKQYPSLTILPPPPVGFHPCDNLITPTTVSFPAASALLRGLDHGVVLEIPAETRRRKSDEMEEEDRIDFHSPAPPVRRDNQLPRSLAHAHTLRSSRTLSHHASLINDAQTAPLTSTPALLSPPASPFTARSDQMLSSPAFLHPRGRHSTISNDAEATITHSYPPSKKVSVMEDSEEDDDNVFGGPIPSTSSKSKSSRARSFSRPATRTIATPILIPSSNSHPGWTGNGFDIQPTPKSKSDIASRTRGRSMASSTNNLDTLSEMGPALDYFSVPTRDGVAEDTASSTPSRRKDEGGFNLLGSKVASTRHSIENTDYDESDTLASPVASTSTSESFPSRRAASFDSLYSASKLRAASPSPPLHAQSSRLSTRDLRDMRSSSALGMVSNNGGRKRNANGALLVGAGSTHGSRLGAVSPIVAGSSSPAPWNHRDTREEMDGEDEEEEDDAMEEDTRVDSWGSNLSPPSLTDGTTSASSSLSTSLSSHAEGDQSLESRLHSTSQDSLKRRNNAYPALSNGTGLFTPQNYKHVRPLQAAFMSTGLVSKRSRGRNDSGIGLGATPLNRPDPTSSSSLNIELTRSADLAVPINPLLASISRGSIMPDTPVKRAAFAHPSTSNRPSAPVESFPNPAIAPSPSQHRSSSISPVGTIMNNAASSTTNSPSPCGRNGDVITVNGKLSPPSTRSLRSHVTREDQTTSGHRNTGSRAQLFRRRSSEPISSDMNPLRMRVGRSGSSTSSSHSSSMIIESDFEPMTPTRSVGAKWPESKFYLSPPVFVGCLLN